MRILLTTFAVKSHIYTQVPLAWALRAAGHDVRVATQPEGEPHVTGAGLTFVPVGKPIGAVAGLDPDDDQSAVVKGDDDGGFQWSDWPTLLDIAETDESLLTHDQLNGIFAAYTPMVFRYYNDGMVDDLVAFAQQWRPDLVLWDTMTFAGAVAAKVCGAAHARLLFGLDVLGHARQTHLRWLQQRPAALRDDVLREWLGPILARYGQGFSEDVVVGQFVVDPVPVSLGLGVLGLRVPVRYVPFNGVSVVPGWTRELVGRERVCVTLGVSHREVWGADRASVGLLVEAVAGLGVEVVATLSSGQVRGVGGLPGNVRVVDFVPLDVLLPWCGVVVSHGGAGSFMSGLVHGVPQVVVPDLLWDTALKGERLAGVGAGLCVRDVDGLSAGVLAGLVRRVMEEPSFGAAARRLRVEALAMPAPSEAVPILERLVREHRR
jgi:glycosyltransferase (activator-dependent family)